MNRSPKPWVVGVRIDEFGWPTYRLRDMNDPSDDDEIQANRRLIEAAPDLLEACEFLLMANDITATEGDAAVLLDIAVDAAKSAITKARGDA